MATVSKMKKAQMGKSIPAPKKKAVVDSVESEMFPGKKIPKSAVTKGPYITNTPKNVNTTALFKSMYLLDDFYPFVDFLRNLT